MRAHGKSVPLLIAAAALCTIPLMSRPAGAEGAIAMGQTDTISTDGLAFGAHYNDFDRNRIVAQALTECTLSSASNPADVSPLISRAQARQKTGDDAGAAADIAAARALRPDIGEGPGTRGSAVR